MMDIRLALVGGVLLIGIFDKTLSDEKTGGNGSPVMKRTLPEKTCSGLCREGCDVEAFFQMTVLLDQISRVSPHDLWQQCDPECKSPFSYSFHDMDKDQISCYKFYPKMDCNHSCAVQRCGRDGAKLVSIETKNEWLNLKKIIRSNFALNPAPTFNRYLSYLTSGTDRKQEGKWIWEGTQQPVTYENWGNDEYLFWEDKDAEDYLIFDTTLFKWWDAEDGRRAVLCERQATCN